MSDPPKSLPTFSFGNTATSGASGGGGLFGQAPSKGATTSNSLFGASSNTPSTSASNAFGTTSSAPGNSQSSFLGGSGTGQTSSIFGGASQANSNAFGGGSKPGTSGFSFGQPASGSSTNAGFGSSNAAGPSINQQSSNSTPFSAFSTPNKPSDTSASGQSKPSNFFGGASDTAGESLFGNVGTTTSSSQAGSSTPATSKPSGGFSFGNASTTPAGPPPSDSTGTASMFGSNKPQEQKSLFGNQGTQSSAQDTQGVKATSTIFGGPSQPSSTGIFGSSKTIDSNATTSTAQPSSSLFGNTPKASGTGLFSNMPAPQSGNIFGNLNQTQDTSTSTLTGKPANALSSAPSLSQDDTTKPSGLFPGLGGQTSTSTPPAQVNASSIFGGLSQSSSSMSGPNPSLSFSSISSSQPASSLTSPAPNTTATSIFSSLGAQPTSSGPSGVSTLAPSNGLFANVGKPQDKIPTTKTNNTGTTGSSTSSAPAQSLNLFGTLGKSSSSSAPSQAPVQITTSTSDGAPTTNLGTSTTGPAPPAQSRLKNKSMDEIITRWASDLLKYQKEFQRQAEKVATWDRMLVENSDKIQKLYGSTLEAERATSEVERQLTAVENDQSELAGWLDHYESEVDAMMSNQIGQGESLQGPDQERERT